MTEHLSLQEIEDFRRGKLSPEKLVRVGDHLVECEACRQLGDGDRLWKRFQSLRSVLGVEGEEPYHLSAEEMSGYLDGVLEEVDQEIVEAHLDQMIIVKGRTGIIVEAEEKEGWRVFTLRDDYGDQVKVRTRQDYPLYPFLARWAGFLSRQP